MTVSTIQTYTFVFTDIEGSTRLWEQFPEAMDSALELHDRLMRDAFNEFGGHIFKTVGDMFCVAFANPVQAVSACFAAQKRLAETQFGAVGDIRVRMGIYTGTARARDNDYFGTALNRVSRLMSAGHGQQVLVSAPTAEFVSTELPDGCTLLELGPHQLRDVERPEVIFQLCHQALRAEFPPLRTLDATPNNLPRELSTFVGRESEINDIKKLIREKSLVTLIGSGGCGKTRLALQIASDLLAKFEHGAWFVDLAPLTDPDLVAQTVLLTLNMSEEPGVTALESLKRQLKSQTTLIVLDNCEHLLDACANVVDQILRNAPNVKVLATSREGLGLNGEMPWRVPSLSVPKRTPQSADDLMIRSEAARLFVERAATTQPNFELTDQNFESVASICTRLDGIPLAIELAAARVKALPVEQISSRLDDRFRLLTGGSRTALPRQQTLRALIDWSYNLLGDKERTLLCRLSVFQGGWDLVAAESICSDDSLEEWEILDVLSQLVDKSLVVFEETSGQGRYRLLETVRQYAREKLLDSMEGPVLRGKHLNHFLTWIEQSLSKLAGPDGMKIFEQIEDDHDNYRAALEWAAADPDCNTEFLRLARALSRFWETRGYLTEGKSWLERALEATENISGVDATVADQLEDVRMRAYNQLGNICREMGEYAAATEAFVRSTELAKKREFHMGLAILQNNLGLTLQNQLRFPEARVAFEESIRICRDINDQLHLGTALENLGSLLQDLGELDRAKELNTEAAVIFHKLGDNRSIAINHSLRADHQYATAQFDGALASYREALELLRQLEFKTGIASAVEGVGKVSCAKEQFELAAKIFGFAERYRERVGTPVPPQARKALDAAIQACRAALKESYEGLALEGRRSSLDSLLRQIN